MKHTPGPWRFELNEKSKYVQLCGGNPKYDLTVMDFARYGFGSAAPRFREDVDRMNIMHRCEKWGASVVGREHHKNWFQRINHPDARLIEAAPDMLDALKSLDKLWKEDEVDPECYPRYWNAITAAREAIEKATEKPE